MKLHWNKELGQATGDYLDTLPQKAANLNKRQQDFYNLWIAALDYDNADCDEEDLKKALLKIMERENVTRLEQLGSGDMGTIATCLLGNEYAHLFRTWLKLEETCPYDDSWYRRAQRSAKPAMHFSKIYEAIQNLLTMRALGWEDIKILHNGDTKKEREMINESFYTEWLAAKISLNDPTVIQYMKDAICSENNAKILSYTHLKAIAISGNRELLEWEGKLLLAAKLQEGLRQAICERMDDGQPEVFLYLLDVICKNNLQRFSSVKRAILCFTGLGEGEEWGERLSNKIITLMQQSIHNTEYARQLIQSVNPLEIYIGLWACGYYNIDEVQKLARPLIHEGKKHQVQTLFHYFRNMDGDNVNFAHNIAKEALPLWKDDPSVIVMLLNCYLPGIYFNHYLNQVDRSKFHEFFKSKEEAIEQYYLLKEFVRTFPPKKTYPSFNVLQQEYSEPANLTSEIGTAVTDAMCKIIFLLDDEKLREDICDHINIITGYERAALIACILCRPAGRRQQLIVTQALGDRTTEVRSQAIRVLEESELTAEQYLMIEDMLRMKYSEMRIAAIQLLMKQPEEQLAGSIHRLITDKCAERRLAALDMMLKLRTVPAMKDLYKKAIPLVAGIKKPNSKEQVLMDEILAEGKEGGTPAVYTKADGFGLYNPSMEVCVPEIAPDPDFDMQKAFEYITSGEATDTLRKLGEWVAEHKDLEYKNSWGDTCLVGNSITKEYGIDTLSKLAYPELWKEFYEREINSQAKVLLLNFMLTGMENLSCDDHDQSDETNDSAEKNKTVKSFRPILQQLYAGIPYKDMAEKVKDMPYFNQVNQIVRAYKYDVDIKTYQYYSVNVLLRLLPLLNKDNVFRRYINPRAYLGGTKGWGKKEEIYPIQSDKHIEFWLSIPTWPMDDALFIRMFTVRYQLYKLTNYMEHAPAPEDYRSYIRCVDMLRAWQLGLIPEEEVYREFMGRIASPDKIEGISMFFNNTYRYEREKDEFNDIKNYDFTPSRPLIEKVLDRILDIELKRGDTETEVTALAKNIRRIEGATLLIRLLKAIGKDTFSRDNYGYYYNSTTGKKDILSKLLYSCYPSAADTTESLKKLIKKEGISEERMVETAMYAPQWIELVEKAIGWKGLASAAYYFHAHTNENCDDKKKAIIARYTPIDAEDLKEGAFDIDWFKDAYKAIGKKRFDVVYDAAKYISSSNSHGRARKFADAVNGKFKATEVKKELIAKRNKDLLMSYGLIPLGKKADKELLERYQYLQRFLKESKEFGAQRQVSEKKAVNIALQNLARNSGYGDVTRLTWSMETELIKEKAPYLAPKEIEGVELYVSVNEEGKSEIKQIKEGKELNSIPAKLKKHPYIEELKTVHKTLKDQYSRSRLMLEQAMEDSTLFEEDELHKLMQNPVIWPLLKNLVFICDGKTGFYADSQLIDANGECTSLDAKACLRLAHPTDLYESGNWHSYQKLLFEKAIRQPFKQVFRELYVMTEEEKDTTLSLRYAGNQIQTRKTAAILKGRRWIADYENGLQKVYYKENIIATIYAMADWFSPADIEAPTLEYVCFYNRKEHSLLKIAEIPPIVFSEVMRDVDLAVSVAHAGGVDPETSHSTIEMRSVLVELTLPMFHLNNVKVKGNFACIEGKSGNYNIHLGSGVIHREGGAQIAVLPVHSQSRGKLFLPFVDEDPKTAEILSKIILFAEDDKIKDPSILNQMR